MRTSVSVCLAPELTGAPFVFWGPLTENCRAAASLGFDAIELHAPGAKTVDPGLLQRTLQENALQLSAVASGAGWALHGLTLSDDDRENRRKAVDFVTRLIRLAAPFGAPVIIGSMQGRTPKGVDPAPARAWLQESLTILAETAAECSTFLLFEPLNRYETNLANRIDQAIELISPAGIGRVKILADFFHMNIEEDSIPEALIRAGSSVGYVHFVDSNRRPPGSGHLDLIGACLALKEIGYDGYLSVEALPYPDSLTAASNAIRTYNICNKVNRGER